MNAVLDDIMMMFVHAWITRQSAEEHLKLSPASANRQAALELEKKLVEAYARHSIPDIAYLERSTNEEVREHPVRAALRGVG